MMMVGREEMEQRGGLINEPRGQSGRADQLNSINLTRLQPGCCCHGPQEAEKDIRIRR